MGGAIRRRNLSGNNRKKHEAFTIYIIIMCQLYLEGFITTILCWNDSGKLWKSFDIDNGNTYLNSLKNYFWRNVKLNFFENELFIKHV